ncbi:MAG: PaaI family thioesterase [Deltaproteobacteria bacterium]|nr:PaaI family thioesterase [Deltaproteobacteria bacterium]MBW2219181.1 PaaI family thioesterase [Deltaproteobacteria bacterium]
MDSERFEFLKKDYVQGFPAFCGFEVQRIEKGLFESRLKLQREHKQQDGFVHAGVIATMADHTAGYSAYTLVTNDYRILTIEFKINYFRPAIGDEIICRARVINRGEKIIVSESEVFSIINGDEKLVSKAMVTLMSVPSSVLSNNLATE